MESHAHKAAKAIVVDWYIIPLLVIPAAWVLDQVKPPEKVPDEFWVWR